MSAARRPASRREPSRDEPRMVSGSKRAVALESPGVLEGIDASLLDIVDHVLTQGIVVTGDLVLGVADVDLVYLRASLVLCAADRVLGPRARKRNDVARAGRRVAPRTISGKLGR